MAFAVEENEMQLQLRSLFLVTIVFAVGLACYRYYLRLPPKASGSASNASGTDRENEYPRYFKKAISQNGEFTLGYFVRYSNEEIHNEADDRITTDSGRLYLDDYQILPKKSKFRVLIRDDLDEPTLIELDQSEVARFMNFWAGDGQFVHWRQLWKDLAAKAEARKTQNQGLNRSRVGQSSLLN